jgi:hypothetical protein
VKECVLELQVHRALLVQDLLELILLVPRLLTMRVVLYSHDFMVWLALLGGFQVVSLAFVEAVAIVALVIVALGEALVLLVLLVGPSLHHVTELHNSLGVDAAKVAVDVLRAEAVLEEWMTSSSVMLVMVARISNKRLCRTLGSCSPPA